MLTFLASLPFAVLFIFPARPVAHPTSSGNAPWQYQRDKPLTDEQRLLYYLLTRYEKAVRPVRSASNGITVKLGLTLTNIFDLDEKNQVLITNVWLDQEWDDELLRWNPLEFNNITSVRIPCDLIWLPDIVLYNNADDYTTGYMRSRAMINHIGSVFWPPPAQLRSTCKIDVTYFPFDSQRCFLKFGSWTYHGFQVDVTNRSDNIDLTNYVVSGEFELISVHQRRRVIKYTCCPEPYPDMTFFLHMRRKTLYFLHTVILPCVMMLALSLLVFCLPPDSGEKIALGVTVLLAFSVFVLAIAEKMPETSDSMPLIGIYLTVVMAMTSVSVVMTVMVLNFHHRGPLHCKVPSWMRWLFLNQLRRLLCMKLPYQNVAAPGSNAAFYARNCVGSSPLLGNKRTSLKRTLENLQTEMLELDANERSDRRYRRMTFYGSTASPLLIEETPLRVANGSGGGGCRCQRRVSLQKDVLRTLQMLLSRQEMDDECEAIANEWRQVAQVIDRLLFWVFLVATINTTFILLIFIPLVRHNSETTELDESLYGIR